LGPPISSSRNTARASGKNLLKNPVPLYPPKNKQPQKSQDYSHQNGGANGEENGQGT